MPPEHLDLNKELRENEFRVAIFGSARIKPDNQIYKNTFNLAKMIAGEGIDLITGGGPGLMQAASMGHLEGDVSGEAHSIGLNISLPFEQKPNKGLDVMDTHERFSTRLDEFMLLSNAVVVMPGGIGTCLEFFYTWQLLQVNHVCKMPIILVGKMWRRLIDWIIDHPLEQGLISPEDLEFVVCIDDIDLAMEIILDAREIFRSDPEACVNWKKYGDKDPDSR